MIGLVLALWAAFVSPVQATATTAARTVTTLHASSALHVGDRLVSANGRFRAGVESDGRVVLRTSAGRQVWASPKTGAGAALHVAANGQLYVSIGGEVRWRAGTGGSGAHDVLSVRNDGVLILHAGQLVVWADNALDQCPAKSGKTFVVDISAQRARMCDAGQQVRTTRVTTGMSAYGYGTPTGTWHVYAKVRDTTLYPAAGGAYPVKYWVPYDGPYGMHDSPWQHFAYGSALYKTRGSHGCTHLPGAAMAWFYSWVRVGTRVTIHA